MNCIRQTRPQQSSILLWHIAFSFLLVLTTASASEEKTKAEDSMFSFNPSAITQYRHFAQEPGNLLFSPLSIGLASAMLQRGARGQTAQEFKKAFQLPETQAVLDTEIQRIMEGMTDSESGVDFRIANAIWPMRGLSLRKSYRETIEQVFFGSVAALDYQSNAEAARAQINNWIAQRTEQKIKELFQKGTISANTSLTLSNAVYFKGSWEKPFEKTSTSPGLFHSYDGEKTEASFMNQSGFYKYLETPTWTALRLPYRGAAFSLTLLLPKSPDGLTDLEASLSQSLLDQLQNQMESRLGNISIPRFTLSDSPDLSAAFKNSGIKSAFNENADFSGMTDEPNEFILGAAAHSATIEVNEEGTVAAAATGLATSGSAIPAEPFRFTADHPFLILLQENRAGTIVFFGRLAKP